jgi:glucose-6-phosphate-specific signal transduction histidine kinase
MLSVATSTLLGRDGFAWATFAPAVVAGWLGDVVGILTLAPLLLVMVEPYQPAWGEKAASAKGLLPAPQRAAIIEFVLEIGGIILAIYFAFFLPDADSFQYYVCLLPLLAIAWQHGLLRAIMAAFLLNVGIVLALTTQEAPPWREIQLFMIVLALLGLFLGALIAHSRQRLTALREAYQEAQDKIAEYTTALDGARSNLEAQVRQRKEMEDTLQTSVDDLAAMMKEQTLLNDKLGLQNKRCRS